MSLDLSLVCFASLGKLSKLQLLTMKGKPQLTSIIYLLHAPVVPSSPFCKVLKGDHTRIFFFDNFAGKQSLEHTHMQKFTPFDSQSRFKKYAINGPALLNTRQKLKETPPSSSSRVQKTGKLDQNTHEQQLVRAVERTGSIRSSVQRIKTGKLDRTEIINRQMTKSTLKRRKRLNTEQKEGSYDTRMNGLKKYVNQLNITCNRVIKGQDEQGKEVSRYTLEARKKLKGQICFTEIDEDKVLSQKKYLKKFQHLAKSLPKMAKTDLASSRESEDCIILALRTIDSIYASIRNTSNASYLHRNNKFLVDYCLGGRVWLRSVFLLETSAKKEAFTMAVKYTVVPTPEQAKRRLTDFIARSQGEDMKMVLAQVQGLYEHLQHCLTQKKISKLMNVTELNNWVKTQPNSTLKLRFSQTSQAQLRLTEDLQSLQAQFGPMREISKISRRKYDQINRTYDRLQSYI